MYNGDIEVNKPSGTVSLLSILTLDGIGQQLIVTSGTIDLNGRTLSNTTAGALVQGGTLDVSTAGSNLALTSPLTVNSGVVNLGVGTISVTGSTIFNNGTFNGGTGTLDLDGSFDITGGTFNAPGAGGTFTVADNWTHTIGGAFNHNSGTVTFDGGSSTTYNVNTLETFNNVTINRTGSGGIEITGTDVLRAIGTVIFADGFVDGDFNGFVEAQGNVVMNPIYNGGNAKLQFSGTASQTLDATAASNVYNGDIEVNKPSGTVSLLSILTLDGIGQQLLVSSGTLDLNGRTLSNTTAGVVVQGGTLDVGTAGSNLALTSPLTVNSGVVNLGVGTISVTGATIFNNGTFNGGTGTLDLDGSFDLTGGTFNAPGAGGTFTVADDWIHTVGGAFNHNSGTVTFDGSNSTTYNVNTLETFNNVIVNRTSFGGIEIVSTDVLRAIGTLTFADGFVDGDFNGFVEAQGNVVINPIYNGGNAKLEFSGTASQTIDATAASNVYNGDIEVNKPSGTVSLLSILTLDGTGQQLLVTSGTLDLNERRLNNTTAGVVVQGGTLDVATVGSDLALTSALTVNSGVVNLGVGTISVTGSTTFNNGTFNGGTGTLDLDGSFDITGGTFNAPGAGGTFRVADNWTHTIGGAFNHNSGTITFDGSSSTTFNVNTLETFNNVTVNRTGSGGIEITGTDTLRAIGALNFTDGFVDGDSGGVIEAQGNVVVNPIYNGGNAKLLFSGTASQTIDATAADNVYNGDMEVNKTGGRVDMLSILTLDGAGQGLTIVQGTFDLNGNSLPTVNAGMIVQNTGNFQLEGGETSVVPTLQVGSTVTYDGTSTYSIKDYAYRHLTIDGTGTFQLVNNEIVSEDLTLSAGVLDVDGFDLTVTGVFSNDATLRARNTETISLAMDTDSGEVEYDGAGAFGSLILGNNYYSVTFNNAGGTWTLPAALDANGSFMVDAGTVNSGGNTINVAGAWGNQATFNHQSGSVVLDGTTQRVGGTTTFFDLTKTVAAADTLQFESGQTTSIANGGTLTLNGASGQLLTLAPEGVPDWLLNVDPGATQNISYVSASDSDASSGAQIQADDGTNVDGSGNINWLFGASILTVDTTSDVLDGNTSTITALIVTPGADGFISLREAITAANNTANGGGGPDEIHFNIAGAGPHTIDVLSALPTIADAVIVDGWTEPDYVAGLPVVELNGTSAGGATDGLKLSAGSSGSTIRGLIINRFTEDGIDIATGSTGNTVAGNWIGLDNTGTLDFGNGNDGIEASSPNNIFGGTSVAERNVVSGSNTGRGFSVFSSSATGNTFLGNYIGTNSAGTAIVGNFDDGIGLTTGANNNTIGGLTAGSRNIISGNGQGIYIDGAGADDNIIIGNYIGTDVTGLVDLGNLDDGIQVANSASGTVIGGTDSAARNVIAGNSDDGIQLNSSVTNSLVQGNYIGVGADGVTVLGHDSDGVEIDSGSTNNTIGGTVAGSRNTIANNDGRGIYDTGATDSGNAFLRNVVHSNTDLGIDLAPSGTTANDLGDPDSGANNLQNFPVITQVNTDGAGFVQIDGSLNSVASTIYRVEFFTNTTQDGSGFGEAERYLGYTSVTTDGSGDATFTATFSETVVAGEFVTATTTEDIGTRLGSTSEFAQNFVAATLNDAPTFSIGDGSTSTDFGFGNDTGRSVVVQSDGKILVGGNGHNGSDNDFVVTRYNPDGSLDTDFGVGGSVTTDNAAGNDIGYEVLLQPDGKIVLAGQTRPASTTLFGVLRFNADGTPDTTFSGDGFAEEAVGSSSATPNAAVLQPDGKILVSGFGFTGANVDFAVARFNTDGSLDTTFSGDGKLTTDFLGNSDLGKNIAVQADGKIVVVGDADNGVDVDIAIARYDADGTLDSTFSGDGQQILVSPAGNDATFDVAIQTDGKILVAGEIDNGTNTDFAVVRYDTNGDLDTSFGGGDGIVVTDISTTFNKARSIVLLSDGRIILAGHNNGGATEVVIAKYLSNGTLDSSFGGGDGITITSISAVDAGYSAAVQANGQLVVTGSTAGANTDHLLLRYDADGTLDDRFALTNTVDAAPTYTQGGPAVVLDSDVQVFDAELTVADDFNGATLTIERNGGTNADDTFSETGTLGALIEASALTVAATTIGTVTNNTDGTLLLTFNSNATNALVDSAMQQIAYSNSGGPPTSIQLDWTFDDGNSGGQGSGGPLTAVGSTILAVVPNTLVVDTTSNTSDGDISSIGNLLADVGTDGFISLSEAIAATNNTANFDVSTPDEILLNIGAADARHFYYQDDSVAGQVTTANIATTTASNDASILDIDPDYANSWWSLQPTVALPSISDPVIIDGYSQTGASANTVASPGASDAVLRVEIDGSVAGGGLLTLNGTSGGSTIRGMVLNQAGAGVSFGTNIDNVVLTGNYIGTDVSGTIALGNTTGINVSTSSDGTIVGGSTPGERNLVSSNSTGISISANTANNSVVQGNYVGTDVTGAVSLGNGTGILVAGQSSVIGGSAAGEGNLISGNTFGVLMTNPVTGNLVRGNLIGTDAAGTAALGNSTGISLIGATASNVIGGTAAGEGNTIAFNTLDGIADTTTGAGDNAILGNSIHGNGSAHLGIDLSNDGVTFNDAEDGDSGPNELLNFPILTNVFQNGANLDIDFDIDLPAGNYRVEFFDNANGLHASGFGEGQTFVGSASIAATGAAGYESFSTTLTSVTASDILNITVTATEDLGGGNFGSTSEFGPQFLGAGVIEVTTISDISDGDTSSIAALMANQGADGFISLREAITAANNTTNAASADEIHFNIAGAGPHSISVLSALPTITDSVVIDGRTDPDWVSAPVIELNGASAGASDGLVLSGVGSDGSMIRSLTINRFAGDGIEINDSDNNQISGNYFGTDTSGTIARGNAVGVHIRSASTGNTIGGTTAADRNVIAANSSIGVSIFGVGTDNNVVSGNYIGTDASGTADLGNSAAGISITTDANSNTIGGVAAGEGNIVAFSGAAGIAISGDGADGNSILRNSIHSNVGIGIDLNDDGVTANDVGDVDTEENELQNFPILLNVTSVGGTTQFAGTLNSNASTNYRIEFFSSPSGDGTGYGEGQTYLGATTATTDVGGNATINAALAVAVTTGHAVSATATVDLGGGNYGDTSEFALTSAAVDHILVVDTTSDVADGNTGSIAALIANVGADGFISLREAMTAANNTANGGSADEIHFNIAGAGPHTINVLSALPTITDAVVIDGRTEPDWVSTPVIELNGTSAGATDGFLLSGAGSDGSGIRGLAINRFALSGIAIDASDSNTIRDNYIGTDVTGAIDQGNTSHGIAIFNGSINNRIGGTNPAQGNVISGNDVNGINLSGSGTTGNTVEGNIVGLNAAGTGDLGNTFVGVAISLNADANTIGGSAAGARNVISGNDQYGVRIVDNGTDNNVIQGNYIGLNTAGTAALGNSDDGIRLEAVGALTGTVIGGAAAGEGNVISGNSADGIEIRDGVTNVTVTGNVVGLNAAGNSGIGNAAVGILVSNSANNTIGGGAAGDRNVLSGNTSEGILLTGAGTTGNKVQGNYIGTNAAGTSAIGNSTNGVRLELDANANIIGTDLDATNDATEGNLVSGNTFNGIQLWGSSVTGNFVRGNLVGVNAAATATIANNTQGIQLGSGANNNTIGGNSTVAANTVGGSTFAGIELRDSGTSNNVLHGNFVGTNSGGVVDLGNGTHGILIGPDPTDNIIGSTVTLTGNTLAFNAADGIAISAGTANGNAIRGNAIYSNTGIGIDLGNDGVTTNDVGDGDAGANNLQNFPVLTSASIAGATTTVQGTLNSAASTTFNIDFYSSPTADPSGNGEGAVYLGSDSVTTDGSGNATVNTVLGVAVTSGHVVTATATDPLSNSSEFSATVAAVNNVLIVDTTSDVSDGDTSSIVNLLATPGADGFISLREAITATNNTPNGGSPDEIHFDIAGGGPHTIQPTTALPFLTDPVIIDGSTEPDFAGTPIIEIDGSLAGAGVDGLRLDVAGNTIRGLIINRFLDDGLSINTNNNTVVGNWIGLASDGVTAAGNGEDGIDVDGASNTVGGTTASDRNVISANTEDGINFDTPTATANVVLGNYIGTDYTGTVDRGNLLDGVGIAGGADGNTIGGLVAGAGNLLSGNDRQGLDIDGSSNTIVQGNLIGTDAAGTAALGNGSSGVRLETGATNNIIGGAAAGARNVISANVLRGIRIGGAGTDNNQILGNYIGTDITGTAALGNLSHGIRIVDGAANNTIGGVAIGEGNTIAHSGGDGITTNGLAGAGNSIRGNSIHSNSGLGIDLANDGVTSNDVGDGDTGPNNLQNFPVLTSATSTGGDTTILGSFNSTASTTFDIDFYSNTTGDASGFGEGRVYLGSDSVLTDGAGNATISTTLIGVTVTSGHSVTATATDPTLNTSEFGGVVMAVSNILEVDTTSDVADGNTSSIGALVAAKGADGLISLREAILATNNTANGGTPDEIHFEITAPLVGGAHTIDVSAAGLPLVTEAVIIDGSTDSDFAGTPIIELNGTATGGGIAGLYLDTGSGGNTVRGLVINRFGANGIYIWVGADNNTIVGNYVGTDVTGSTVLSNGSSAISVSSDGLVLGGPTLADRNVVAASGANAIQLANGSSNHVIQGNLIGVGVGGGALGSNVGILIGDGGGAGTLVGGDGIGEGNTIAHSSVGIRTSATSGANNAFIGNSIFGNTNLGIDLATDGVTSNDIDDVDTGTNDLLNYPILTNVFQNGANLDIDFDADLPAGNYRIEFFDNSSGLNSSGFGEGETLVGFASITATGAAGYESFSTTLSGVTASDVLNVTATVTEDLGGGNYGSTSEFGPQFEGAGVFEVTTTSDVSDGDTSSIAALLGDRGADGEISLREAIIATNNTANLGGNPDEIRFNIAGAGVQTISPTSGLPSLTDTVVIDGLTQTGSSAGTLVTGTQHTLLIELNGSSAVGPINAGLEILADDSIVRGLVINNWNATASTDGIEVSADNVTIENNYIGTNTLGTAAAGTQQAGVFLANTTNSTIRNNLTSGNSISGIVLDLAGTTGNTVVGNISGLNAAGNGAIGGTITGVRITNGASGNTIGGTSASDRNILSANTQTGIRVNGPGSDANIIIGNYIGVDRTGSLAFGNGASGIQIGNSATGTIIGGTVAGEGNTIAFNGNDGVTIISSGAIGHSIIGNSIHSNTELGIDLFDDGVTANDPLDADIGANQLQNAPVVVGASVIGGDTTIVGTFHGAPGVTHTLHFYSSPVADPTGYGEGAVYLGSALVTTDGSGDSTFSETLIGVSVTAGHAVTATATGPSGSTSEFGGTAAAAMSSAPILDLDADNSSGALGRDFASIWTEDGGPILLADADAQLFDPDSTNLASLTLTLTNNLDGASETLTVDTSGTAIVSSYLSGTLTLTGNQPIGDYLQVLRTASYDNSSQDPNTTVRLVAVTANDGVNTSGVGTSSVTIVSVNDPPLVADDGYVTDAGVTIAQSAPGVLENDTDVDGSLTAILLSGPSNGLLNLNLDGSFDYTPTVGFVGNDSFTYQAIDGLGGVAPGLVSLSIQPVGGGGGGGGGGTTTPPDPVTPPPDLGVPDESPNQDPDDSSGEGEGDDASIIPDEPVDEPDDSNENETVGGDDDRSKKKRSADEGQNDEEDDLLALEHARLEMAFWSRETAARLDLGDQFLSGIDRRDGPTTLAGGDGRFESIIFKQFENVVQAGALWTRFDAIREEAEIAESVWGQQISVGTAAVVSMTMSSGYLLWALRSGYLLVGLATSVPAWSTFDPLPILQSPAGNSSDGDGESLVDVIASAGNRTVS